MSSNQNLHTSTALLALIEAIKSASIAGFGVLEAEGMAEAVRAAEDAIAGRVQVGELSIQAPTGQVPRAWTEEEKESCRNAMRRIVDREKVMADRLPGAQNLTGAREIITELLRCAEVGHYDFKLVSAAQGWLAAQQAQPVQQPVGQVRTRVDGGYIAELFPGVADRVSNMAPLYVAAISQDIELQASLNHHKALLADMDLLTGDLKSEIKTLKDAMRIELDRLGELQKSWTVKAANLATAPHVARSLYECAKKLRDELRAIEGNAGAAQAVKS